jgi:hypothetical protein
VKRTAGNPGCRIKSGMTAPAVRLKMQSISIDRS